MKRHLAFNYPDLSITKKKKIVRMYATKKLSVPKKMYKNEFFFIYLNRNSLIEKCGKA